jgi:porphobilinogen synthase
MRKEAEPIPPDGVVQKAVREIKNALPELVVMTDVCLCEYTDHGHCGLINGLAGPKDPRLPEGYVLNDRTLEILGRTAVSQAEAGADVVAPSGMLDGMVAAIRRDLDAGGFALAANSFLSVKYASGFYGPFRDAPKAHPASETEHPPDGPGQRKRSDAGTCPGCRGRSGRPDGEAGARYLDVIRATRDRFPDLPLAAYNVSGEYSMVKAAAANGWVDERRVALEILTGIRRAGADLIITYHARDAATWLAE